MLTFDDVKSLARGIQAKGGRLFIVGGFVRDQVLGRNSKDFDCEVFGLEPERLEAELKNFVMWKNFHSDPNKDPALKLNKVGQAFQVFKVGLNLDVSLPRRDSKVAEGHKGFEVTADPFMSFKEAARRRDFTMNAMFLDPLTGEIVDPFNGQIHLENKLLIVVDKQTFVEDSLRALRAVQFAARFDLDLGSSVRDTVRGMDLRDLPRERVWMEFEKLLLSPKPSVGLHLMRDLGILEKLFPEIHNLIGVPQDVRWHPEGDVFVHTALALDVAAEITKDLPRAERLAVLLATLCHDLGKVETTEVTWWHKDGTECSQTCGIEHSNLEARVTAHGHAEAGVSLSRNVLDRLAIHSIDGFDVRGTVLALVEFHMHPMQFHRERETVKDSAFRRLATKTDLKLQHLVLRADAESRNFNSVGKTFDTATQDWFLDKITNLEIPRQGPEKLLMGRHLMELGVKPSKGMGEILNTVFEAQLEGEVNTLEEALEMAKTIMQEQLEATENG
jgi:tRNA nucleotidyltransferase (CCA-adding enzyme)